MNDTRNVLQFHRCAICRTTALSWHHLICLACALHADCHRYAGSARDMYRRAAR